MNPFAQRFFLLISITLLLLAGANAEGKQEKMIEAASHGRLEQVKSLLASDTNLVNAIDPKGKSAIQYAAENVDSDNSAQRQVVQLLLKRGAECDLFTAARAGILDEVKASLQFSPDFLNARNSQGMTALQISSLAPVACKACGKVARYLMDAGAEVDLFTAARWGLLDEAKRELERHSGKLPSLHDGSTPLHWAVIPRANPENSRKMVALLLGGGGTLNEKDEHGRTPLHYLAHRTDDAGMARFLVEKGADAGIADAGGKTAAALAHQAKHENVARALDDGGNSE